MYADGSFLAVWETKDTLSGFKDIKGRLFDRNAKPVGIDFPINDYTKNNQTRADIAINIKGDVLVCWESFGQDLNGNGVYMKRYKTDFSIPDTIILTLEPDLDFRVGLGKKLPYDSKTRLKNYSKSIKVGVIDTGVSDKHPNLQSHLWQNPQYVKPVPNRRWPWRWLGRKKQEQAKVYITCVSNDTLGANFVVDSLPPIDSIGHGTGVNGMLAQVDKRNRKVKLELINAKFYEKKKGTLFDAVCGIYYAIDAGAKVLNLSWGFESEEFPKILLDALKFAAEEDVVVVCSAGNTAQNNDEINKYPGNLKDSLGGNMIVVSAYQLDELTDKDTIRLSNYSSYGKKTVHLAARGYVETLNSEYGKPKEGKFRSQAGTSVAAPQVARTAAIIKAECPDLSAKEVVQAILESVDEYDSFKGKLITGGVLNHENAMKRAKEIYRAN